MPGRGAVVRQKPWTRRRRRRVFVRAALGLAATAIALLVGAAAVDLVRAQRAMASGRATILAVDSSPSALGDEQRRAATVRSLNEAASRFGVAEEVLRGSISLRLLEFVPNVRYQFDGARQVANDGANAAVAASRLVATGGDFVNHAAVSDGAIPVARLGELEAVLEDARRTLSGMIRGRRGLWGPLGDARVALDERAMDAEESVARALDGTRLMRAMSAEDRERRYLLVGLNNAEMRDQGMVLSFALVHLANGRFNVERTGPIADLAVDSPVGTSVPEGTLALFRGLDLHREWRSANATAHFPTSGQLIADLFAASTGLAVDGVIGIDVPALAAIVSVTGPVRIGAPPRSLDASTVVSYLLSGQYEGVPVGAPQDQRLEDVATVARGVLERLRSGSFGAVDLGQRLAESVQQRRLVMWAAAPDEQAMIERLGAHGGLLPPHSAPVREADERRTFHWSVQDASATKVDYYNRVRVDLDLVVGRSDQLVVRATVEVDNTAPSGPRSYALGPQGVTERPGDYVGRVYQWGPLGSQQFDATEESGLLAVQKPLAVRAGERSSVHFDSVLPKAVVDGQVELRLVPQPRHVPLRITARLRAADGVALPPREFDLVRTTTLRWQIPSRNSA